MYDLYRVFQRSGRACNGRLVFTTATDDTTLITAKTTSHTIYVQRIIVYITTDAAQSISFQDSNASPFKIAEVTTSPGDETRWDFDFGPKGIPLTAGKNLVANFSAVGLAGHMEWNGYQILSSLAN